MTRTKVAGRLRVVAALLVTLATVGALARTVPTNGIASGSSTLGVSVAAAPNAPAVQPAGLAGPLPGHDLNAHAPPIDEPLHVRIPAYGVDAPVLGVGLTPDNAMDAPGSHTDPDDPNWRAAFWYRGGFDPDGQPGVSTIAAHVDDIAGRPGPFAQLHTLKGGDVVEILDTRNGAVVRYTITSVVTYAVPQANSPRVLEQIFGHFAVTTDPADKRTDTADGVAHLSLITCFGDFVRGAGYDQRVVAYAVRA